MKKAGRSHLYVFGLWTAITVISGIAALIGYAAFRGLSGDIIAAITALAAGAMLAMLADTMIPEAFDDARNWAGLITVAAFLRLSYYYEAGRRTKRATYNPTAGQPVRLQTIRASGNGEMRSMCTNARRKVFAV